MHDHLVAWLVAVVAGCTVTVAVAVATRVRLLPEVIDISLVPTCAGIGSLVFAGVGAVRRFPLERIGRLTLLGTLLEGAAAALILVAFVFADVLS